jgi:hypothetical protein
MGASVDKLEKPARLALNRMFLIRPPTVTVLLLAGPPVRSIQFALVQSKRFAARGVQLYHSGFHLIVSLVCLLMRYASYMGLDLYPDEIKKFVVLSSYSAP